MRQTKKKFESTFVCLIEYLFLFATHCSILLLKLLTIDMIELNLLGRQSTEKTFIIRN